MQARHQPVTASCRSALKLPVVNSQQAFRRINQAKVSQRTRFEASPVYQENSRTHTNAAQKGISCRATAGVDLSSGSDDSDDKGQLIETAKLAALFGAWYLSDILFNIYNKQIFSIFKYPLTTTLVQFLFGSIISLSFWASGVVKRPHVDTEFIKAFYPLAIANVIANVLSNVSLGLVAVSFATTVKAVDPFFSVIFSYVFLGELPPVQVLLTLLPIVAGIGIASASEVSFNWIGFLAAIASCITFLSRNVFSKKFMMRQAEQGKHVDSVMLFQVMSIMSFLTLLPVALLVEGPAVLPGTLVAAGMSQANMHHVYTLLFCAGICFHTYQQLSYVVLSKLSFVSHSVGNCCKRVAVIVASIIWFKNPISTQTVVGTAIAVMGALMYIFAKRIFEDHDHHKDPHHHHVHHH